VTPQDPMLLLAVLPFSRFFLFCVICD